MNPFWNPRFWAKTWLTTWTTGALGALYFSDLILAHQLDSVLKPGYDAFGRNCLTIALRATGETLLVILPWSFLLFGLALAWTFLKSTLHRSAQDSRTQTEWFSDSFLDLISSLPGLLIGLSISAYFKSGWISFGIAAVLILFPPLARFFQGIESSIQHQNFYRSAVALGAPPRYLFKNYSWPELKRGLHSIWPMQISRLILIETSFSFLGLAPGTGVHSWGRIFFVGKDYLLEAPWIMASAAVPLCLTLLSFHLLSRSEQS